MHVGTAQREEVVRSMERGAAGQLRQAGGVPGHHLCAGLFPCGLAGAQEVWRWQFARRYVRCRPLAIVTCVAQGCSRCRTQWQAVIDHVAKVVGLSMWVFISLTATCSCRHRLEHELPLQYRRPALLWSVRRQLPRCVCQGTFVSRPGTPELAHGQSHLLIKHSSIACW